MKEKHPNIRWPKRTLAVIIALILVITLGIRYMPDRRLRAVEETQEETRTPETLDEFGREMDAQVVFGDREADEALEIPTAAEETQEQEEEDGLTQEDIEIALTPQESQEEEEETAVSILPEEPGEAEEPEAAETDTKETDAGQQAESSAAAADAETAEIQETIPAEEVLQSLPAYPAQSFEARTDTLLVRVTAPEGALPAGCAMDVKAVEDRSTIRNILGAVEQNSDAPAGTSSVFAVDITFLTQDGMKTEPLLPVIVALTPLEPAQKAEISPENSPVVVHVDDAGDTQIVSTMETKDAVNAVVDASANPADIDPAALQNLSTAADDALVRMDGETVAGQVMTQEVNPEVAEENLKDAVIFQSEKFSIYAIVVTVIEKNVLASDGHNYKISVTYGPEAGVPEGADLEVTEILQSEEDTDETSEYDTYLEKTKEALGMESGVFGYVRFFDIRIVDKNGNKVEITAPVDVKIELADKESVEESNTQVVHFTDGSESGDVVEIATEAAEEGQVVSFAADGFSVYAIVDAKEAFVPNSVTVRDLSELNDNLEKAFLLSYSKYFMNSMNGSGCYNETAEAGSAAEWYFEKIEGEENRYYIYTWIDGTRKYMHQKSGNNMELSNAGTAFEVIQATVGRFYIKHASDKRWLQHSNGGGGIRLYTDNANATNSQIIITYAESVIVPDDYYGLDHVTAGIAYDSESIFCTALMSDSQSAGTLPGRDMAKLDTQGYSDHLFVPLDSDITEWTFHSVREDLYYITTNVNGTDQYLTIQNGAAGLSTEPSDQTLIKVTPGTGDHEGFYAFSSGKYSLVVQGKEGNRYFTAAEGDASAHGWMKLAYKSSLSEDDYLIYSAQKISVSDPAEEVILYTRVWNETQYDFYAIDHDGTLIRCYDDGDVIKWVGNQFETAVWKLTEHTKTDEQGEDVPNGYYELYNLYSKKYINPQLGTNTIFSNKEAFLNLDGRYYQEDYTDIRCWDSAYYSYMGLKVDLANNRVVPSPASQADDFYFARVKASTVQLTKVDTVDNDEYGITMKMIDFQNAIVNARDSKQSEFFGRDSNRAGLLTSDIKANGYPNGTVKNESLQNLFAGDYPVNHLFIQSVYDESGYFEYDSTKNFAWLNGTDFEVYDQLGTVERPENKSTMYHGQFMPFNTLINPETNEPWPYSDMYSNTRDVLAQLLSEDDPRYGEGLHEIPLSKADYFFGMEMSASFTQTPSGLDAWGHDIIFEFSGDDDFWLYVDGELVLDLGGVHSAMTGSVNFRTGMVKGRTENSLREIFEANYKSRNPGASKDEVNAYLSGYFDEGGTVFRDFSTHTMQVYYMERGAGASNLHMRFNLTAVKPGEVTLSKKVTGSDDVDFDLMEFPYKILYLTRENTSADGNNSVWNELTQNNSNPTVTYEGSKRPVKFAESFTPVGETTPYSNVFFLKAGETASINLPEDVVDYKIVECGVNMNIFKSVKANNETLSDEDDKGRHDYETSAATIEERAKVEFENEVDPDSLRTLTITKVLWDEAGFTVVGEGTGQEKTGTRINGYDDTTTFSFRVSMSAQGSSVLEPVRNKEYYVKDLNDNYCKWNAATGRFESLNTDSYTDLAQYISGLTPLERSAVIFETSNNGAVSEIPGGYSVEFRGLPVDSSFSVMEREDEIPAGYSLVEYERDKDSFISETPDTPNRGIIRANEDPHILVHNKQGWGLTVNKVWSDADYMEDHDDIYFAIYVKGNLLPGSERRLSSPDTSVYYYFDELAENTAFTDYVVREVLLTDPVMKEDGTIRYSGITPIDQGETISVGGTPMGESHLENLTYDVSYTVGEQKGGQKNVKNVRTDTVTNTRRGIRIVKKDWEGSALSGAVFTLKDSEDQPVGVGTFTSDQNGLVTIAYLEPGTYILEEITPPSGFQKPSPWTIIRDNSGNISVTGDEGTFAVTQETNNTMAMVELKNKGFSLQAVKVDANSNRTLQNAVFALYRQVDTLSGPVKDQIPMEGYSALTTDAEGVIPLITSSLAPGTYYLSETAPPPGYQSLEGDLVFTISTSGEVIIPETVVSGDPAEVRILNNMEGYDTDQWITDTESEGHASYTITIPNELAGVPVKVMKIDQTGAALEGAIFYFTGKDFDGNEESDAAGKKRYTSTKASAETEAIVLEHEAVLPGTYTLHEETAPEGYIGLNGDAEITVFTGTDGTIGVSLKIGDTAITNPEFIRKADDGTWMIKIQNTAGYELPATGGPGTLGWLLTGLMLFAGALALFVIRNRSKKLL